MTKEDTEQGLNLGTDSNEAIPSDNDNELDENSNVSRT
jgi:hypothetical protein